MRVPHRRLLTLCVLVAAGLFGTIGAAFAQAIEARHWQGATAVTRQPEHIVATTMAEWRSLWSRVGMPAPDVFEPGRMSAVAIFLGRRASEGYAVNILSTSRRRDRIFVVFEERMPADIMLAQRVSPPPPPTARPLSGGPSFAGAAGFAPPGSVSTVTPPPSPQPARPFSQPTSPWAIVLIHRADLPISVEQRLFR